MLNFLARPVFHLENMHVVHTDAWYYTVYSQINRRKRRLEYSRIKPCETKCHRDYSATVDTLFHVLVQQTNY